MCVTRWQCAFRSACRGIRIRVSDPAAVRAFTLVVALLRAIRKHHPESLRFEPSFDVLAGGPWLREQIEHGMPAQEVTAALSAELEAFDKTRPRLYPSSQELLQACSPITPPPAG